MALTKADLVYFLMSELDGTIQETKEIIDSIFEEIRLALENGEEVKLSGFGIFHVRDKEPRPGRNPRTGQAATIPARRVVSFKASRKLKQAVDLAH